VPVGADATKLVTVEATTTLTILASPGALPTSMTYSDRAPPPEGAFHDSVTREQPRRAAAQHEERDCGESGKPHNLTHRLPLWWFCRKTRLGARGEDERGDRLDGSLRRNGGDGLTTLSRTSGSGLERARAGLIDNSSRPHDHQDVAAHPALHGSESTVTDPSPKHPCSYDIAIAVFRRVRDFPGLRDGSRLFRRIVQLGGGIRFAPRPAGWAE
jgi:hypothetical protein